MDFYRFVELGLKRELAYLRPTPPSADGIRLNIGCGNTSIIGTVGVDHPSNPKAQIHWDADCSRLPYMDHSVAEIHCYHFLEHVKDPVRVLMEFQRVLVCGGVLNIVVPHYSAQLAIEDLDHKHQFCEDTWKTLFKQDYYNHKLRHNWQFTIGFNLIVGVVERNLCVFTQLIKN